MGKGLFNILLFSIFAGFILTVSCSKKVHTSVVTKDAGFQAEALWNDTDHRTVKVIGRVQPLPSAFRCVSLNTKLMHTLLHKTVSPAKDTVKHYGIVELPLPEGGFGRYRITETPTMERALLDKNPGLRTYGGQGIDEPTSTAKIDFMPNGFHGYMSTLKGAVFIRSFSEGDTLHYISYYKQNSTEKKETFEKKSESDGQRK